MKKWITLAATGLLAINAQASTMYCGYKDYFHLSNSTNPNIYVASGFNEHDVDLQIVGPRSFVIKDSYQCRAGYAHLTVVLDANNWCTLHIKDGPYMNHPTINASCNGLFFYGMNYEGLGTYSYSIKIGS